MQQHKHSVGRSSLRHARFRSVRPGWAIQNHLNPAGGDSRLDQARRLPARVRIGPPLVLVAIALMLTGMVAVAESRHDQFTSARVEYGLLASACLALLVIEGRRGWTGVLTPISMTALGFLYFFCPIPIFNPDLAPGLYAETGRFRPVLGYVALALISFTVGYYLAPVPRWLPMRRWLRRPISPDKTRTRVAIVFGLYFMIAVYMAMSGGFSLAALVLQSGYASRATRDMSVSYDGISYYLQQVFRWLPIALSGPTMLCLLDRKLGAAIRVLLLFAITVTTLAVVGSGTRYLSSYFLGGVGITYILANSRRGKYSSYVKAFVLALVIFFCTWLQLSTRELGGLKLLLTGNLALDPTQAAVASVEELGADQNYSLDGVIRAERRNEFDHLWGETYVLNFVMLVPRALWPSKPGASVAEELTAANPFRIANVSYSVIGELIFNFTQWSVAPGMFLFGLIAGIWRHLFRTELGSPRAVTLYAMSLIPFAFMVRGSFATMFGALMYPMIITIVMIHNKRYRSLRKPSGNPGGPQARLEKFA